MKEDISKALDNLKTLDYDLLEPFEVQAIKEDIEAGSWSDLGLSSAITALEDASHDYPELSASLDSLIELRKGLE